MLKLKEIISSCSDQLKDLINFPNKQLWNLFSYTIYIYWIVFTIYNFVFSLNIIVFESSIIIVITTMSAYKNKTIFSVYELHNINEIYNVLKINGTIIFLNETIIPELNLTINYDSSVVQILLPVLCLFGLFGNSLCILILGRKKNRQDSMAVYLLCLGVSDIVIIITGTFSKWIFLVWNFDISSVNGFLCKTHTFLIYFSIHFSSWILVLVTVERVLSVMIPHKVRLWCDRRKGLRALLVLAVVLSVVNGHFLVGMELKYDLYILPSCRMGHGSYVYFVNLHWNIIDLIISFAMPSIIIITGNAIIGFQLAVRDRRRRHIVASGYMKSSLACVLLLISAVFIISMGPSAIYNVAFYLSKKRLDYDDIVRHKRVRDIVDAFASLNAALNFIMYFLGGSKFRKEVKAFFCCKEINEPGVF